MKNHFLVFSDNYGEHPSSAQHIFNAISKDRSVTWVNTLMRRPRWSLEDLKRGITKIRRWAQRVQEAENGREIRVLSPICLPWTEYAWVRKFNAAQISKEILKQKSIFSEGLPIVVASVPNVADAVSLIPKSRLVYYCVDDFIVWPGVERKSLSEMEKILLDQCDVFVGVSESLLEKKKTRTLRRFVLSHGVDTGLFSRVRRLDLENFAWNLDQKPVIGYFGLLDERVDLGLVDFLSRSRPSYSFVFLGPVRKDVLGGFKGENVYFHDAVAYDDLPRYLRSFDVTYLPYKKTEVLDGMNPLKFKEALACGKPVVSWKLKPLLAYKDFSFLVETEAEFLAAIDDALKKGVSEEKYQHLTEMLKEESWERKAEQFLAYAEADT